MQYNYIYKNINLIYSKLDAIRRTGCNLKELYVLNCLFYPIAMQQYTTPQRVATYRRRQDRTGSSCERGRPPTVWRRTLPAGSGTAPANM